MKSENKKVLFIINKFSGVGYSPALEGKIIETCTAQGLECHIEFTAAPGHATELATSAKENQFAMVFAVGGDGTVNEVAKGLVQGHIPMGILPKGSGNGLARHLGIPMNFIRSLSLLQSSQVVNMDTFMFNGRQSVNVSGIGFDGHIAGLFGKNGKRGLVNYTRLVMSEYARYQEFDCALTIDGKLFNRSAFMIAFANSSQFGNNARVAPHASVCDGWLDVSIIKKVPLTQAMSFAYKLFNGKLEGSRFVEIIRARHIEIHFSKPMACHVDGETIPPAQDFEIAIVPHSLPMLVPGKIATQV